MLQDGTGANQDGTWQVDYKRFLANLGISATAMLGNIYVFRIEVRH